MLYLFFRNEEEEIRRAVTQCFARQFQTNSTEIINDVTFGRQKRAYLKELSSLAKAMTDDEKLVTILTTSQTLMLDYVQVQ